MSKPKITIITDCYAFDPSSLSDFIGDFINEYFSNCDVSIINNNGTPDIHYGIECAIHKSDAIVFYCHPGNRLTRWQTFYLGVVSALRKPRFVKSDDPINEYRNYGLIIKHNVEVEQRYLVNKDMFKFILENINDINNLDSLTKSTTKITQFLTKNGVRDRDEYDINNRTHNYTCTIKTISSKDLYARNEFEYSLNSEEYESAYNSFMESKNSSKYKNTVKKLRHSIQIHTYDGEYVISFDEIQLGSNTLYVIEVEGEKSIFTDLFRLLNYHTNISESTLEKFGDSCAMIRNITNLNLVSNKSLSSINLRSSTEVNTLREKLNELCKDSFVKNIKEEA